jgi:predicted DNA-binding WGR domain protein
MSDWKVSLSFSEGSSNKFWRARTDGSTLYVNFGRIGSDGQTQIKEFGSGDAADKELAKLEKEKRKKGYEDAGAAAAGADDEAEEADSDEDEEEEAPKPKAAPKKVGAAAVAAAAASSAKSGGSEHADFALTTDGMNIDLRLSCEGNAVRTVVVQKYANAAAAQAEFKRSKDQMVADGYKAVAARETL